MPNRHGSGSANWGTIRAKRHFLLEPSVCPVVELGQTEQLMETYSMKDRGCCSPTGDFEDVLSYIERVLYCSIISKQSTGLRYHGSWGPTSRDLTNMHCILLP